MPTIRNFSHIVSWSTQSKRFLRSVKYIFLTYVFMIFIEFLYYYPYIWYYDMGSTASFITGLIFWWTQATYTLGQKKRKSHENIFLKKNY